ncbi:MAG: PAS domain-containing protein [Magnetococcales bacterium]|nr:PAS domain-containing protein [Magnetococcales bacterium]
MTLSHANRFTQLGRLTLYRLLLISLLLLVTQREMLAPAVSLSGSRPHALDLFVGGLFLLSLLYALWLKSGRGLELLTRVQCAMDPILVSVLVVLTGGLESPLHVLYGLATLNTALLLGRRNALAVAGLSLLLSQGSIAMAGALLRTPPWLSASELFVPTVVNGVGFLLTALLGGALAERVQGLLVAVERQKDSLADLTSLHEQIIEAAPMGLISVNTQGVVRGANGAIQGVLGLPAESLLGRPLQEPLPQLSPFLAPDPPASEELEFQGRILAVNAAPLRNSRRQVIGALLTVRDLSERKRLERELAEREKLALTGRMAAFLAHEIRNPLASILSAGQMLSSAREEQRTRLQEIILEEVGRLKQLTGDFLFFARPPQPQRRPVPLTPFFAELEERLQRDPHWGPRRALRVMLPEALQALVDPHHLTQLVWNILLNAAQAGAEEVSLHLDGPPRRGRATLALVDDGPGMDPALLSRALEPFFTTRPSGTGLGLAVAAQLIHLNGGDISLENLPGRGLKVRLTLETFHG